MLYQISLLHLISALQFLEATPTIAVTVIFQNFITLLHMRYSWPVSDIIIIIIIIILLHHHHHHHHHHLASFQFYETHWLQSLPFSSLWQLFFPFLVSCITWMNHLIMVHSTGVFPLQFNSNATTTVILYILSAQPNYCNYFPCNSTDEFWIPVSSGFNSDSANIMSE